MQLKVQIISYDVLITGLFFLPRTDTPGVKNLLVQISAYPQNKTYLKPVLPIKFLSKKNKKEEKHHLARIFHNCKNKYFRCYI